MLKVQKHITALVPAVLRDPAGAVHFGIEEETAKLYWTNITANEDGSFRGPLIYLCFPRRRRGETPENSGVRTAETD